jgi:hypothetical protein
MARTEQIVEVPGTVEEAVARAWAALSAVPKLKGPPVMIGPGAMHAKTKMTFRTWGDTITVEVRPGPSGTRMRISSECFQLIDWGRGADNIGAVLSRVGPYRPGF